jgi:predicted lipoprotein with Yx(FWY)xxD motif
MKKVILIVVAVVIIIGAGSFFIFYKPSKPASSPSPSSSSQSQASVSNAVLITKTISSIGSYLADPNGNALYTYSSDTSGVSNCTGSCLANWPAYQDKGSTTGLPAGVGTIKRTDNGQIQYTYNGMPLYYFVSDSNGSVTGNNVEGFKVAVPLATATVTPSPTPSSSSSNSSGYPY